MSSVGKMTDVQVQDSVYNEELFNLNAEVEHTKRRLRELEEQRERLKQIRAAQFGILPSFRRVPVEIMSEIFQLAVPETVDEEGRETLTRILCVCRDWLDVALSTSCLWASLDLVIGRRYSYHSLLPRMSTWFSRAGPLPLTLSLVGFNADTSDASAFSTWISTKCWKNLKIKLPEPQLKPIFHNLKEADGHCWGRLHSLSLRSWGQEDDMILSNTEMPFIWGDLPCLRHLALFLGANLSLAAFQAPWGQLTTLNLAALLPLAEYLDILKQCVRLEVCEINRIFKVGMDEMIFLPEPIVLPNLCSLSISKADNVTPLLTCLRLPAVTDLSIDQVYPEPDEDEGMAITEFITRSQCSIRHLTLENIWAEDESIAEILKASPALVEFTFRSPTSDGSFLEHCRGADVIPNLQKIEFEGSPMNFIPPNFFNFVMSRSTRTLKLTHASFRFNPPLGEQRIRESGVELGTEY